MEIIDGRRGARDRGNLEAVVTRAPGDAAHPIPIRNKQATAMLQSAIGVHRVIRGLRDGVPVEIALDDLVEIEQFLRRSAFL